MNTKQGITPIIIAGIVAVLALAAGGYFYTQKQSQAPEADWQPSTIEIEERGGDEDNKATEEKSESVVNDETAEIATIIQSARAWCQKYLEGVEKKAGKCPSVTFWSIIDISNEYAVTKANGTGYLLFKKNNQWNVAIASEEDDICSTGSGSSILYDYCSSR